MCAPVAQLVEREAYTFVVLGSSPSRRTTLEKSKSFGSPRGVYPDEGGTRRPNRMDFSGQKEILKNKIREVYYPHLYGNDDGIELLHKHGIKIKKIK